MENLSYFNDMLAKLEELFYHEISGTCVRKVDLIGTDFLQNKSITGNTVKEIINNCIKEIKAGGLVKDITYSIHGLGIYLKLMVRGCVHIPKEARLKKGGIEPYICPIANMVLDRIIEVGKYERAIVIVGMGSRLEIDERKGECLIRCAIYETADKIGQVSDWTKF